jgi:hypothetical protein
LDEVQVTISFLSLNSLSRDHWPIPVAAFVGLVILSTELKGIAVDSGTRIRHDLQAMGIENVSVKVSEEPQFAVWRGCIVFGYSVPHDYLWSWERMEGWMRFK